MPFAIWCTTCPKPTIIGQGVRFNAEKKKIGNYHSTPIFSFRMKHNICGGWIEIRTDPKNTAYVVTDGAKKRDTGEGKYVEGEIKIMTDEERERLHNDAFAALEVKIDDRKQLLDNKSRIEELQVTNEKDWDDPYAASKKLRKTFRVDRKRRQENEATTEDLKNRMSLGIDLLDETEEDRQRAGLVTFGNLDGETAIVNAKAKPLFVAATANGKASRKPSPALRTETEATSTKEKLRQVLGSNTRAALDPFLHGEKTTAAQISMLAAVKRKRSGPPAHKPPLNPPAVEVPSAPPGLVDYDSD